VADRHVVVDESARERAIALDRQADERRGGREQNSRRVGVSG
jgi:hypothetical protein